MFSRYSKLTATITPLKTDKMKRLSYLLFVILFTTFITSCNHVNQKPEYGEAAKELVKLLDGNPDLKAMLIESLEKAHQINPDRNTNPVKNLEEYYEFVSWAETAMPWALLKNKEYPEIFDHIFQSICCFYFLIDQPLPELEGKGLVNNSLQYYEPFATWLITFSKSWGSYLDTKDSWNDQYYQMALHDPNFGLQHGWYEDPSNWSTFNEFFARYLKRRDMRPIESPEVDSVVVSFADAVPQGVWAIDGQSNLLVEDGVPVKSATIRSISKLIGDDSAFKDAFANGTFTHSFLNVNDYHRYHFPVGGIVREVRIIQGINPTGGEIRWDRENGRYAFNPTAKTGWQSIETRGFVILATKDYGLVALLPIGMAAVGSVNFEATIVPGAAVEKGDMLGHFAFGGSDFVMVFQEQVRFTLDAPIQDDKKSYKHQLMGERLGYLTKK